jgi:hypothetical protein
VVVVGYVVVGNGGVLLFDAFWFLDEVEKENVCVVAMWKEVFVCWTAIVGLLGRLLHVRESERLVCVGDMVRALCVCLVLYVPERCEW